MAKSILRQRSKLRKARESRRRSPRELRRCDRSPRASRWCTVCATDGWVFLLPPHRSRASSAAWPRRRTGDISKFCIVHRAPPGNRGPGSGPRAAPGSAESYEIGMDPPRAKFGPASSVFPPKQRYVIRFNPDLKLNLLRSQSGSNPWPL